MSVNEKFDENVDWFDELNGLDRVRGVQSLLIEACRYNKEVLGGFGYDFFESYGFNAMLCSNLDELSYLERNIFYQLTSNLNRHEVQFGTEDPYWLDAGSAVDELLEVSGVDTAVIHAIYQAARDNFDQVKLPEFRRE